MANNICSKEIKVGELDIHYLTGGEGDPLIVIHGGGGSGAAAWLKNANELSRHYSVYVPDLPGFGRSKSMSDRFNLSEFVEFVEEFSHSLGIERFHLVGHSIGAAIALHYALRFPQRIRGLVLVSSWCLGIETALWVRVLSHAAFCKSLGEIAIAVLKAVRRLPCLLRAPFKSIHPLSRVKIDMGRKMTTLKGQTTVLLHRLSELLVPTLLVWGSRDSIVPVSHAYVAAELIPDCQLHVFEGCGHSVYSQRSREFSQLLTRFLD